MNYITTHYVVEGKRETLEKIKDAIDTVSKQYSKWENQISNRYDVLIALGLSEEISHNLGDSGGWYDAEVKEINGNVVLTLIEDDLYGCVMEQFAESAPWCDDITAVYRRSEEPASRFYETTDLKGKYFPESYHVYTRGAGNVYFMTKEEALAHARQQFNLSADYDTLEKIQEYCDAEYLPFSFDEINKIGGIDC